MSKTGQGPGDAAARMRPFLDVFLRIGVIAPPEPAVLRAFARDQHSFGAIFFGCNRAIEPAARLGYHSVMSHDFTFQRRETFDTFRESKGVKLPARAVVDFAFFPEEEEADWTGLSRALEAAGYRVSRPDAEEEGGEELIASTGPITISAEEIWKFEEAATKIALRFDFYPDGWELDI